MREYIASEQVAALTSAGTVAVVTAPAGEDLEVYAWHLGAGSIDTAENNTLVVARATGTAAGGSEASVAPLDPDDSAYAGAARVRTQASALSGLTPGATLFRFGRPVTDGFDAPPGAVIVVPAGTSLTFALEDALTAADVNWWVAFRARMPERP